MHPYYRLCLTLAAEQPSEARHRGVLVSEANITCRGNVAAPRAPVRARLPLLRFRPGGVGLDGATRGAVDSLQGYRGSMTSQPIELRTPVDLGLVAQESQASAGCGCGGCKCES